jgi:hypothetical protein
MQKMQKIQKRHGFNGSARIGRPVRNWPKMQKFASEATAVHAHPSGKAERRPSAPPSTADPNRSFSVSVL